MSVLLERQSIESLVMPKSGEHGLDHALARKELWNRLAGVTEKGGNCGEVRGGIACEARQTWSDSVLASRKRHNLTVGLAARVEQI